MDFKSILTLLPEVGGPKEKRLSFNVKLKWTLIVLISFFVLANIPLYGLAQNSLDRFKHLAIILGTNFGSIISLGIGPIVMASIILQLLVGSKILDIDMNTDEGRRYFTGLQKLLIFFFIIFEAIVYVLMRGLQAAPGLTWLVIFQLILGGLLIVFMDELVQKWGFGQGVSLFIAAGVGWRLFTGAFQFLGPEGNLQISGKVLIVITSILAGSTLGALKALAAILSTAIIFLIVVWAQSLKVEVPLSFDRLRGYSIKWPLSFFYASVIPVILTAALVANLQLFGSLIQNWLGHPTFLGNFVGGVAVGGLAFWLSPIDLLDAAITGSIEFPIDILKGITHILFYMVFATIFSIFWVKTSGMDAQSQANNILSRGLQISGFRKDRRILESVLSRYILPLTVMGGAAVGLLAAAANLLGALISGTALLLGIMIMFQFYQNIAQQHAMDMHPALKKFMG
jgi:preprotein translocase subunit SecY